MLRLYKSDYTIAYVNFSLYICIASHMTEGRGHQRMECPFFRAPRRAERRGAAPAGSKVVLPPLFPLPDQRAPRNTPMPQTFDCHPSDTEPLCPRYLPKSISPRRPPPAPPAPPLRAGGGFAFFPPALLGGAGGAFLPAHPGGFGPAGG